jgi:ABC-2 type transport system permease protein
MIILFGMPVVQVLIFGFAITTDIRDAKISILDHSKDYMTQDITRKLLSSGYFVLSENLNSEKDIETSFRKGKIKEVVIFENHFAENFEKNQKAHIQLIADASDPNTANLIVNYTSSIINDYQEELLKLSPVPVTITSEVKMLFNPELKSVFMFVPGTITILLMLISAMMTSISIVREKEMGTMEVLLVSPLKPAQIIIGKVIPYFLFSFIIAVIILLMGFVIFKMPMQGSYLLLLGETILFIIMALSLGILISTLTRTQQVAMMISMVALMLPTMLLSGFIYPIENMPVVLQWVCQLMPPKWFIIIIKSIILKGSSFSYIWKETLILFLMTLLFIFISIKKFKIRLQELKN